MRAARSATAAAGGGGPGDDPHVVELQPEAFAKLREAGEVLQCIDVREEWEHQTASLAGFQLRPLSRMSEWCAARCCAWRGLDCEAVALTACSLTHARRAPNIEEDFDKSEPVYVLCHHGVRSRSAANWLVSLGWVGTVYNISGGIDAWTRRVDGSVPMY